MPAGLAPILRQTASATSLSGGRPRRPAIMIVGASIDRSGNVAYMSIATSPVDERDPSVLAVGNGRFLVAYEKIGGGDRRLAGRFIDFEPRRRTVRN